jgi:hypothetical protein
MAARRKVGTGRESKSAMNPLPLPDKWDGTPESKERLHYDAQRVLRAVAMELGLGKDDFEVDSNEMGPAIGGSIGLYTDTWQMRIEGGYGFHAWGYRKETAVMAPRVDSYVVARRWKDRKNCAVGEKFVALDWELLWDPKKLVEVLRLEGVVS